MTRRRKTTLNRLYELREARGWSQEDLAAAAGVSTPQVSRYETGTTPLFPRALQQITDALGLSSPADIVTTTARSARLLGYVGAGAEVFPLDEDGEVLPAPPGLEHPVAVRVRGTSMMPAYRPGDTLFVEAESVTSDAILNRDCLVETVEGRRLVKRVLPGGLPGTVSLLSYETQDVEPNVRLRTAAPVRWVRRA